jgi:hypothetical protein
MFSMDRTLPVKSYRQIRLNTKLFIGPSFSFPIEYVFDYSIEK